jgi:hypothetical protein
MDSEFKPDFVLGVEFYCFTRVLAGLLVRKLTVVVVVVVVVVPGKSVAANQRTCDNDQRDCPDYRDVLTCFHIRFLVGEGQFCSHNTIKLRVHEISRSWYATLIVQSFVVGVVADSSMVWWRLPEQCANISCYALAAAAKRRSIAMPVKEGNRLHRIEAVPRSAVSAFLDEGSRPG